MVMKLNSSQPLGVGADCWRYAFNILKFLVANFSVNKVGIDNFQRSLLPAVGETTVFLLFCST